MADTGQGTLGVDLDGTLAEQQVPFNPYSVGPPVLNILHKVRAEIAKGRHVVCFTARASSNDTEMWRTVRAWLDEQGLYGMRITNTKTPDISEIWDDRARQVLNGEVVKAASAQASAGKTAVLVTGNPKYIENNPQAEKFYGDIEAALSELGYTTSRDPGLPHTEPAPADLWVGHSRGMDRLRWAPSHVKTVRVDDFLDPTHLDPTGEPTSKHFEVTDALLQHLVDLGVPSPFAESDEGRGLPYQEEEGAAFTHAGQRYDLNAALRSTHDAPTEDVPVTDLAWMLEHDKPTDNERVDQADLKAPVLLAKHGDKTAVVDGLHRLARAVRDKALTLPARWIDPKALKQAAWDDAADEVRGWFSEPAETKSASTAAPPTTGPGAIMHALKNINLDVLEKQAHALIATGKLTKRDQGIKMLGVIDGMKRNELKPTDLMITKVPVLPPAFRPYGMMGNTYLPGVANELYGDMFKHIGLHKETLQELGPKGAVATRRNMYDSVRALFGYGDPVSPKLHARGNVGYMKQITGPNSPKFSFAQRRMFSKTQDNVARGAITVAPHLNMNQIGIPKEMAWDMLHNIIQGRLARGGMSPMQALEAVRSRSREADIALQQEIKERPFIYSRAPAWHQFNTVAGYGQLIDGDNIAISPYVTAGLNADFDGDTINLHVPVLPESVQEAKDKLMPDKMLFSIKSPDQVMAQPKHEQILGLFESQRTPSKQVHKFGSHQEALAAIQKGTVSLSDDIDYPD